MVWVPAVTVKLPYPVSANRYWGARIVTPRDGEPFIQHYVTPEARNYKEAVGWLLRNAGVRRALTGRVRVDLQLWPHCPKDWQARQRKDPLWWADTVGRIDLDNARKVVTDALKGIAIEDDFWIWKDGGDVMEPDPKVEQCVVVRICKAVKDNPQGALL